MSWKISFILDITKLENINDLLADGCGSWLNDGQHSFHYRLSEDGEYKRIGKGGGIKSGRRVNCFFT